MKKKTHVRPKKGLKLSQNKRYFGWFLLVLSLALLLNATYAWTSFARWRYNHMQGNEKIEVPKIVVEGQLGGVVLGPGKTTKREAVVTNLTERPVFIRVKVSEVLALLEVDTDDRTGNGHLKETDSLNGASLLKLDVPSSWQIGNKFQEKNQTSYYQVSSVETYDYLASHAGRPSELAPITLDWGKINPTPPVTTGYWMYQEQKGQGYFYYSELVNGGDSTQVLLNSLKVSSSLINSYKGALYRVDIQAEAGEATTGVYGSWGIPEVSGTPVYDRFQHLLSAT